MMHKKIPPLGGHVSAQGGLSRAIARGEEIGATTIQIFGASPRQWAGKMPSDEEIAGFREAMAKSNIESTYLHASYLVNLGSPEQETVEKSIKNLALHLTIAERIGAKGLIFHVGSGKTGITKEEAIIQAGKAMKRVLAEVSGTAWLIIENAAGGGQKLGATPEEIAAMMHAADDDSRIKACLDTAHAFEAGLIEHYTSDEVKIFFDRWDEEVGVERLVALHVNDSKTAFNSHHDRHENLGEGYIGLAGFRVLAEEERLMDKAWLLEVPGFDDEGPDKKNMDILKGCFAVKNT